jgi:hypothetical protein
VLKGPNPDGVVFNIAAFGTALQVEVRRSLHTFSASGHEGHEYLRIVLGLLSLVRQVLLSQLVSRLTDPHLPANVRHPLTGFHLPQHSYEFSRFESRHLNRNRYWFETIPSTGTRVVADDENFAPS